MVPGEIITRRILPHWYVPRAAHFVTYRLAGTIPASVLQGLRARREAALKTKPLTISLGAHRARQHKLFFAAYDRFLDHSTRVNWLRERGVANMIRENLYHHNAEKYHLLAYCVMPNHVHILLQPIPRGNKQPCLSALPNDGLIRQSPEPEQHSPEAFFSDEIPDGHSPLSSIMHSLKSYTANQANKLLNRSGQFWQHESYDHWVRDEDELARIIDYIRLNPVRANLVGNAHDWPYCSAYDRFKLDGSECGFLLGSPLVATSRPACPLDDGPFDSK